MKQKTDQRGGRSAIPGEKEARIRNWEEFRKPTGFVDDTGITRLR
jgi:hypothetical protein